MRDKSQIFWVTNAIAQGGYPLDEDFARLRAAGVTHLFNLDLPYVSVPVAGLGEFSAVILKTIPDGHRIPDATALEILDALHAAVTGPESKIYVHCHAGISRSPTVVWLYLVACGKEPDEVVERFAAGTPHAIPGNPALLDAALLEKVRAHGRARYLPHPRPEALAWVGA